MVAGRGFGKARTGAELVRAAAEASGDLRIALVGATAIDARGVMVVGESGLLATAPASSRPLWEPSRRRLSWKNGGEAFVYSAEEPGQWDGPSSEGRRVGEEWVGTGKSGGAQDQYKK